MKASICIDSVFRGMDSVEAISQVKATGFTAYEFWTWKNRDIDALAAKAKELGLACVCLCTSFFNLTEPGQRDSFLQGIKESAVCAKKVNAPFLITQSGSDTGAVRSFQRKSIVAGLKAAVPILEEAGVTILLEPLNGKINHQGIYLESSDEGFDILNEVNSKNVKMLFDTYHQQITEGDILRHMTSNIGQIAHIHCAGNPGRHELESGELDYNWVIKSLESAGYKGYAGIEYFPEKPVAEGLKNIRGFLS